MSCRQRLDDLRRQLVPQPFLLRRPLLRARERRAEDQAADPGCARKDVLERQHAAPRRAEQVDPVEPELRPDRHHFVPEEREIPLDVAWTVG
jgi:hypothetical protein